MKTFIRFNEYNDHEGESWNWWLQLTGNEEALDKLAGLLKAHANACEEDPNYTLHSENIEPEEVVDKLVEYTTPGYFRAHNKVLGVFTCPDDLGEYRESLYKGGIRNLFEAPA